MIHPNWAYLDSLHFNSAKIGLLKRLRRCPEKSSYFLESQMHVKVQIYLIVGIQLVFLVGNGSCKHDSPVSIEVGGCNSNFGSDDPNFQVVPCFEKYMMKSYFEKYDSLLDPDFQNFIAYELPLCSCKVLPPVLRLSVVKRYLIGEGSHRRLFSSVQINIQPESMYDLPPHFCEVLSIERLPWGVFADPFELQHLLQRGVFTDAAVFGDTNLEVPSIFSNRSVVEVHMDIGANILTRKNRLKMHIELPLHARYPPLEESGYVRVEFGASDLFVRCSIEGKAQNESCLLMFEDSSTEFKTGAVVWQVPSGMKAHAKIVSLVTFISAFLSAVSIVVTSISYSHVKLGKYLKQS